jgi:hypothetical protein
MDRPVLVSNPTEPVVVPEGLHKYWMGHAGKGIELTQRDAIVKKLREAWDFNHIEIPLPSAVQF